MYDAVVWSKRPRRGRRRGVGERVTSVSAMLLLILTSLLLHLPSTSALWPLPEKRFRYQGLINAGPLGLDSPSSGIAAWGDWDGDQYLDAFLLSSDRKTLTLQRWDHTSFKFSSTPLFSLSPASSQAIINVVPADINRDGHLDVLLMTKGKGSENIEMEVWFGTGSGVNPNPKSVQDSTTAQPMLLDATADMKMDLLGFPSGEKEMRMWENVLEDANATEAFQISPAPLRSDDSHTPCQLADPHSSAFIDLNGDCMADLFLVCAPRGGEARQEIQIWTATSAASTSSKSPPFHGFTYSRPGYLPPLAGALSFADMNRDGTIDVVFTTCDITSGECHINVAFNRQMGLCEKKASAAAGSVDGPLSQGWLQSWKDWWRGSGGQDQPVETSGRCRRTEELCVADEQFVLDFEDKSLLKIPLSTLLPNHMPLIMDTLTADSTPHPIPLALGDFDKDGYPDVLLLTVPPGQPSDGSGKTSVHILRNIRCGSVGNGSTRELCRQRSSLSGADSDDEGRWLIVNDVATEVLDGVDDARSASWVDIDEDGSLDVVLQRGHRTDGGKRTVTFVQNNYFYDAFFLKALTLNGACGSICEEEVQDHVTKYKPWGASLPGASYKFTVLDPNGNRRAQQVGQQYASTYRSLLTPYSYFGLGRTNNYVETLFVGSTLHDEGSYLISMEGVIPNSQVVISPGKDGQQWHRELYLQPGDWIPWVTVVLVTLIVALCGFVFAMHVNERREDEQERKRAVHAINFDALG